MAGPEHGSPGRASAEAFVAAGVTGLVAWAVALFLHALLFQGATAASRLVPYIVMGGLIFGVPIVILVLAAVALPLFLALRDTRRFTLFAVLMVGGLSGGLAGLLVRIALGDPERRFVPTVVVVVAGVAAAGAWWKAYTRPAARAEGHRGAI